MYSSIHIYKNNIGMAFFILLTAETKTFRHLNWSLCAHIVSHTHISILYILSLVFTHSKCWTSPTSLHSQLFPFHSSEISYNPLDAPFSWENILDAPLWLWPLHHVWSTSSSSRNEPSGTLRAQPFYQVKNSKTDGDKKVQYLLRQIRSAVIYVTWVSEMGLFVHPVGMFLTTLTRNESEDLSLPCFFPTIL